MVDNFLQLFRTGLSSAGSFVAAGFVEAAKLVEGQSGIEVAYFVECSRLQRGILIEKSPRKGFSGLVRFLFQMIQSYFVVSDVCQARSRCCVVSAESGYQQQSCGEARCFPCGVNDDGEYREEEGAACEIVE